MGKGNCPPFPQFLAGHPPFFHPAAKSTPSEVSWPPSQHSLQSPCSLTCDNVNMLFHFVKSPSSWVSQFHKLLLLTLIFLQPHKMQLSSKFISFSLFMLVTYDRNPIQTSSSKKENVLVPKIEQFVKRHVFRYSRIQGSKLHLSLSLSLRSTFVSLASLLGRLYCSTDNTTSSSSMALQLSCSCRRKRKFQRIQQKCQDFILLEPIWSNAIPKPIPMTRGLECADWPDLNGRWPRLGSSESHELTVGKSVSTRGDSKVNHVNSLATCWLGKQQVVVAVCIYLRLLTSYISYLQAWFLCGFPDPLLDTFS